MAELGRTRGVAGAARSSEPRDRRVAHVVAPPDLREGLSRCPPGLGLHYLMRRQLGLPAELHTPGHRPGPPLSGPRQNQRSSLPLLHRARGLRPSHPSPTPRETGLPSHARRQNDDGDAAGRGRQDEVSVEAAELILQLVQGCGRPRPELALIPPSGMLRRRGPSRDWIEVKNPDSPPMRRAREGRWLMSCQSRLFAVPITASTQSA
jgi:hypothetical protein